MMCFPKTPGFPSLNCLSFRINNSLYLRYLVKLLTSSFLTCFGTKINFNSVRKSESLKLFSWDQKMYNYQNFVQKILIVKYFLTKQ